MILGGLFDVPGSLPGANFQIQGTTPGPHPTVLGTPEPQLSAGDLRHSAVMNILTSFIADCGDLMDILSGHGVTTKGPHSDVSWEVKNFTQALRRHDSFGDPSAQYSPLCTSSWTWIISRASTKSETT
ncbi:hypothetical protein LB503_007927 [Fusarium chuoi]|nr:hypothetical protein LB503_007927 [Fusarium chuoi]